MKAVVLTFLAMMIASPTLAQSAGDWRIGAGIKTTKFVEDSGMLSGQRARVKDFNGATITGEYFFRDDLGIEVQASIPFKQVASYEGTELGTTKYFPVSAMALYRLSTFENMTAFAGAGLGFAHFYDAASTQDPGSDIKIKDSWGVALAIGADFAINKHQAIRADMRWNEASAKVSADGTDIGQVRLNPTTLGISYLFKF